MILLIGQSQSSTTWNFQFTGQKKKTKTKKSFELGEFTKDTFFFHI